MNFLRASEKVKISNFIGGFCLKDNLTDQKLTLQVPILTVKSCGKFQQNLNPGFQFSTKKLGEFSPSRQEGQNFKFYWLVLSNK